MVTFKTNLNIVLDSLREVQLFIYISFLRYNSSLEKLVHNGVGGGEY